MEKQKAGIIVSIILGVLVVAASLYYFFVYKPAQDAKEKARLEQLAREKAEEERKKQQAQRKARYDQLIKDADVQFNQETWEEARTLYTEASGLFPNQTYPQDQLLKVDSALYAIAALQAGGTVTSISSPTNRYYIVVSSSVDGDLAMDYAIKLSDEGHNIKIIGPDAVNELFHRVSVADYLTWDEAINNTGSYSSFGGAVWVLKY